MNKYSKKKREKKLKSLTQRYNYPLDRLCLCVYVQNQDPHKSIRLKAKLPKEYYNPKKITSQNLDPCVLGSSRATWYYLVRLECVPVIPFVMAKVKVLALYSNKTNMITIKTPYNC